MTPREPTDFKDCGTASGAPGPGAFSALLPVGLLLTCPPQGPLTGNHPCALRLQGVINVSCLAPLTLTAPLVTVINWQGLPFPADG